MSLSQSMDLVEPASDDPEPSESQVTPLLFGFDGAEGVVAVEVSHDRALLIRAAGEGGEERVIEERPFRPWLLVGEEVDRERPELGSAEWTRLKGKGLVWLAEFPNWSACLDAREALRASGQPHHCYGSPAKQFLIRTGITLFRGMEFNSIRRMQVDLETTTLSPTDPAAKILLIVAGDNRGGEWVFAGDDERVILEQFVALVRERNPDTLEGHHFFGFDLPYLAARAEVLGVPLRLGRDGSTLSFGRERNVPIGGITRPFRPATVWGRHLLDTLFAVQRFDIGRSDLESHGLKEVARHYGLEEPDRVYLDRALLGDLWKTDPERVTTYAVQDIRETRRVADLTLPTEFYQSQMVPENFQNVAIGGSGEKINSLLIREYLRHGCGVPLQDPPVACPGGHTEIRETGVLRRIVKADVESLYPSIMLNYGIAPQKDTLGVFLPMLRELTQRRLEAKARARKGGPERDYWDGLQSSFKILINSFYGYLGAAFHFNDYQAAAKVTTTGQTLVLQVADELENTGSKVIEIDTDGVYFVPPADVLTEEQETAYVERIGAGLPGGIRLAHDGRYAAMVSIKVKNYVLVGYDRKKTIKGASLRSRAEEPFGREFLQRAIDYLINDDLEGLARDYAELRARIAGGQMQIEEFARRERVTQKTFNSEAKKRSREVAKNSSVGESIVVYQRADGTLGLAEEYAGDEDRWHYTEKLYRFAQRLQDALGAEFDRIIPKPTKKRVEAEVAGQLSLF
jgi:DNA polymerase I